LRSNERKVYYPPLFQLVQIKMRIFIVILVMCKWHRLCTQCYRYRVVYAKVQLRPNWLLRPLHC